MTLNYYTYIPSIEYINELQFDYIETYSFQRGAEFEEQSKKDHNDYLRLSALQDKKGDLSELEIARLEDIKNHGSRNYLINDKGEFHPYSEQTGTFSHKSEVVQKLNKILNIPIIEIPSWMCAPFYRDAIVFYDKDKKIVSTLNVCLSCEYMETSMYNHITADEEVYKRMREFFIDLGHKVEDKY